MYEAFSDQAITIANNLSKAARTTAAKDKAATMAADQIEGLLLYLGCAWGPEEAAMLMYRLADAMVGEIPPPTIEARRV